ncbi:MAG: transglutaminase domain-containing protein [Anaerolineae bacterium]|nr:transglutaminase domain-containing protein [Anaerolineae bacterium]MDW8173411.1 transglutaminase domain-containing protein [Anaerolineae bacterium]
MHTLRHLFQPRRALKRSVQNVQDFFTRGDFWAMLLALIVLLAPSMALIASGWALDPVLLLGASALGVVCNTLLARSRYDDLFAFLASCLLALGSLWLLAALSLRTNLPNALTQVIERLSTWLLDAFTGGISQDNLAFSVLVGGLFWILAYNAVWHIFRLERAWRAALPSAALLALAVILYEGEAPLDGYVLAFALAVLLLLVRSNIEARQWAWYSDGFRIPPSLRPQVMKAGALLALILVSAAWLIPSNNLRERLDAFQEFLRSDPIQALMELANRLLTPIEADGPPSTDYYSGDSLNLGGAIRLGDQPIFFVEAPRTSRYFWRARVFERYDQGRWSPSATWRVTDSSPPLDILIDAEIIGAERVAITQTFVIASGGLRLFHAAAIPTRFDQGGRIDITRTNESLGDASPMNVSVVRPLRVLERGSRYQALSQVSRATPQQLREATGPDPAWVTNPNALLGTAISPRIIELAKQIVAQANASTRYDAAKAIETWLRRNIVYNEAIPNPPANLDRIDWFLFELRQGYCTYYATAMVLMLRSLGIPSRMVAGFAEGEWDASLGRYVVRERDAHTWVEVYFPGYGWIEFEPTAAQRPLTDETGDVVLPPDAEPQQPLVPPSPTPTFTPSPSPTPLPSPTPPDSSPSPPDSGQPPPSDPPAFTPTPTPTPTPTAVIVPTVPPPLQPPPPPDDSFLAFLLRALGAALLIFLLLLLLILALLLLYWWWEWRGFGGLSPISRAFGRLERYAALIGFKPRPQQTPEEKRQDLVAKLPQAEQPISVITRAYSEERYGHPQRRRADEASEVRAERAWSAARSFILRRRARRLNPFRRRDDD